MPEPIAESWNSYLRKVLPINAPPDQIRECRRAFYAGAKAAIDIVETLGEPQYTEEFGVATMIKLDHELLVFKNDVLNGRA